MAKRANRKIERRAMAMARADALEFVCEFPGEPREGDWDGTAFELSSVGHSARDEDGTRGRLYRRCFRAYSAVLDAEIARLNG